MILLALTDAEDRAAVAARYRLLSAMAPDVSYYDAEDVRQQRARLWFAVFWIMIALGAEFAWDSSIGIPEFRRRPRT
jgi:hypothetical protein